LVAEAAKVEGVIANLDAEAEVLLKVNELFRVLMDRLVMDQVRALSSVVTEGLKTIFHDQDLSFEAELTQKYNRIAVDLYLCSGDPERGGIKGSPLDAFGGGPSSIASLVLRILTLLRMKRAPVLLLDETLAAVSDDYIEATGQFLQKLAESSKLDILLVTHKPAFLDHADSAYQGEKTLAAGADPSGDRPLPSFSVRRMRSSR
jgi:hypothetical protein